MCFRARRPPTVPIAPWRFSYTLRWLAVEDRQGRSARIGIASKAFQDRQPKPERALCYHMALGTWHFALDRAAAGKA